MYFASVVDKAMELCFLLDQEIKYGSMNWDSPLVLFTSTRPLALYVLQNPLI